MDAILLGVSQSRNPNLASFFYRLKLVESYGTGIRKIKHLYSSDINKPKFKTAEGAFSVILPNRNENINVREIADKVKYFISKEDSCNVKEKVIEFVESNGSITMKQVEEITSYKSTKAYTPQRANG
ncbi:MAG: hypothetical protein GX903_05320 [Spirochaetales bacterium]|jgi:ATP-dependent DNA helicase RecG|nr:hypothetical protein [Spirochaetales bacterium]